MQKRRHSSHPKSCSTERNHPSPLTHVNGIVVGVLPHTGPEALHKCLIVLDLRQRHLAAALLEGAGPLKALPLGCAPVHLAIRCQVHALALDQELCAWQGEKLVDGTVHEQVYQAEGDLREELVCG